MFKVLCWFSKNEFGSADMDDSLILLLVSVMAVAVLT